MSQSLDVPPCACNLEVCVFGTMTDMVSSPNAEPACHYDFRYHLEHMKDHQQLSTLLNMQTSKQPLFSKRDNVFNKGDLLADQ